LRTLVGFLKYYRHSEEDYKEENYHRTKNEEPEDPPDPNPLFVLIE
jgi:hypothetical protein